MNEKPLFGIDAVRAWVGDLEIGKGRPYAAGAAVSGCVLTGTLLKSCVKGTRTRPYRVWVQPGAGAIEGAGCTCPVGRGAACGAAKCKHVAATLLAYLEAPNRFVKLADVYADLEARDKSELVALVMQVLQRAPEVEPLLAAPLPGVESRRAVPPDFYFWQTAEMIRGVNLANDRAAREIAEWVIEMLEDNFAFDQCDQGDVFQAVLAGIARAIQGELPENIREQVLCELPDDLRWTLASPTKNENEEIRV
ncbi:MAG: SWIM zinc finger family protein [Planctomycetes bacterium]|nr:SWIM zinc finger family protein [Planctomycetota bacterium]